MRHTIIVMAAVGIAVGTAACSSSGTHHGQPASRSSGGGGTGRWTVASCQVDVTYIDQTNSVERYAPDTDANFQRHYAGNAISGDAAMAIVIMFVNNTGRRASLPTGLAVSFTDKSGNSVGSPHTFNNANGTGYGPAIANGHGSGETFSASTQFNPGEAVAESPDIGASVPHLPDLNCRVSQR